MFEVKCSKVPRSPKYKIIFLYNQEIIDIIRTFHKKDKKWVSSTKHWELSPLGLFNLIKHYKGSDKIFFNFGGEKEKLEFLGKYKKAKKKLVEEEKERQQLEKNKKIWLEKKVDFEENYEKYQKETHENLKEGVQLYPFQVAGTEYLNTVRNVLLAFDMGLGKAQPFDSKLITPDGYKFMGDIQVGDSVIGDDGKPTVVLGVYPQGEKDIYEVVFNDGSKTQCCKEHLWNVRTIEQLNEKYDTISLEEILQRGLKNENNQDKFYISLTKPVQFNKKIIKINPYFLGRDCMYLKFRIPDDYLYNSIEFRLNIIRGFIDSHNDDNNVTISNLVNNNLFKIILDSKNNNIFDIISIIQSLGGMAKLNNNELLVVLSSEFELCNSDKYEKQFNTDDFPNKSISEVNYIGKKQAQCIKVDNKSSLYLTDDYIVTHNTLCSIAYVEMNQEFDTTLVITPNSLKFNYFNEVNKFTDSKAHIINWKNNIHDVDESKYIIVNYDYFRSSNSEATQKKFWDYLGEDRKLNTVVLDESQKIKNPKSNTYKNIKKLLDSKSFKNKNKSAIFMSGTPAPNAAHELYTVLNQISPIDFATKTHFYEYYCGMTYNFDGFGYDTNIDNQRLEELFHKISPYVYRKKKIDVLDLPEKVYQNVMLEMSPKEQKIYDEIADDVANEIFSTSNSNPLTVLLRLRQYTSLIKINYISDIIDTVLEAGEKLVIADSFKPILKELKEKYSDVAGLHTGDQDVEFRGKLVDRFQNLNDPLALFLASVQTANYGLTLTAASKIIVNTIPYSVGELDQVVDRIYRIGQKSSVNIYFPIFKDTIDEIVYDRVESKRREISKVIDNEDYESVRNDSLLNDILSDFKKKYKK